MSSVPLTDVDNWNNETTNGIKYRLMEGYPKGSFETIKGSIQEQYLIQSKDLEEFVEESFPLMTVDADDETWVYPYNRPVPGNSRITSRRVSFEPFPSDKPCVIYSNSHSGIDEDFTGFTNFLKVTIDYESTKVPDDDDPTTFLEISADGSAEFLMIPMNKDQSWGTGGTPNEDNENFPFILPEIAWSVKWPRVVRSMASILISRCRSRIGTVNSLAVPILYGAPVESILFAGFSIREQFQWQADDYPILEFDLKFLEKNIFVGLVQAPETDGYVNHNVFFKPEKNRWEPLKLNDQPVYQSTDLNAIWTNIAVAPPPPPDA